MLTPPDVGMLLLITAVASSGLTILAINWLDRP
jgi:hypothetical protein